MDGAALYASATRPVGRAELLDRLSSAIPTALDARTVLVELVGEPGIGKSVLLQSLYRRAGRQGLAVVTNTCPSMLRAAPYSAVLPLLRHLRTGLDGDGRPVVDADPDELHHAVRARLDAADRPLLVGVDDAHAADPQSLGLLGRLLHDPPTRGLILAVSYRPAQAPAALAAVLRLGDESVQHDRLDVGPVSAAALGDMLDVPAGRVLDRLHRASGGNPLYALVLAGELADDPAAGHLAYRSLAEAAMQAVRSEFAGLDDDETTLLAYAAAAGATFEPASTLAACPVPDPARGRALERLLQRDLLRTGATDTLRFRHPVLRALVYRQLSATTRRRAHSRLAAELASRQADHPDLVTHVSRSATVGDLSAVRLLLEAARRAGPHDPRVALNNLTTAQRLLGAGGDADLRAELNRRLAMAHLHSGRSSTARTILHAGVPAGASHRQRLRHVLSRARADRVLGHHREALAALRAAIEDIGDDDNPGTVLLNLEAAVCAAFGGDMTRAEDFAALARRTAGGIGDTAFHAVVSSTQAFLTSLSDNTRGIDGHIAAAAEILDGLPDSHLAHLLDPFGMLGWAEMEMERDHDASRHLDRAVAIAEEAGHLDQLPFLYAGHCYVNSRLGRLTMATTAAQRAVDTARQLDSRSALVLATSFRASVAAHVSGPDAARHSAEASLAATPTRRDLFGELAQRLAVRIRANHGDPGGTPQALLRACGGVDLPWVEVATRPYWCTVLAEMYLSAGQEAPAGDWVDRAAAAADGLRLTGASAHVSLARSRLLAHRGRPEPALADADAAVAGFEALGWVLDEIVARLLAASLHATLDRWPSVAAELAAARRLVERTESPWLRQTVIGEQRRLQARVGGAGTGGLSRREREIAALAAEGATNGDIAARLHVTVKTVEAHLSRIYRKLGVRSRAMLASALARNADPDL